jgi:pseudouridine synthase
MKQLIQKYLAEEGLTSRREGERLLKLGKVLLNGKVARAGDYMVAGKDIVTIEEAAASSKETVMVNKLRGLTCSKSTEEGETVFSHFPELSHLNTIGRLDKDSEGMIILSNDGRLTRILTDDEHSIEKEYLVTVREKIPGPIMNKMEKGIMIDKVMTLPAKATLRKDKHTFILVIRDGRKHQIRRMCDACGLTVVSLKRLRIGGLRMGNLKYGQYKKLTDSEITALTQKSDSIEKSGKAPKKSIGDSVSKKGMGSTHTHS